MVNFRDPAVEEKDYLMVRNFYLTMIGIYLWEFFTTLGFEFNIIRGHRPYRWTIWIYSLTRVATLMTVIIDMIDIHTVSPINCQVWVTFELVFGYLGLAAASLLIILRVIAIWNRNTCLVAIAASLWVTNVAVMIQGVARLRSDWSPAMPGCNIFNSDNSKLNIIVSLVTDVVLLLTMLVGLFRIRGHGDGKFGLGLLLWKQGVMWLFLATIAEFPPAVLIVLNLNDSFNLMFQLPALIVMTIAATRMYRSLANFTLSTRCMTPQCFQPPPKHPQGPEVTVDPSPTQPGVSADTLHERCQISRTSHHDLCINMQGESSENSQGLGLDDDSENPVEKHAPV